MEPHRAILCGMILSLIVGRDLDAHLPGPLDVAAFRAAVLKQHNHYRAAHGVPPLVLSPQLHAAAQQHAEQLARTNQMVHSGNPQVGGNLYTVRSASQAPPHPEAVVDRWYSEIHYYNFNTPGFQARTGHFTQVVWQASQALGVGIAHASDGTWYVVGTYRPPGNIAGQFPTQVLPPTR